jgi:hypothetical protein
MPMPQSQIKHEAEVTSDHTIVDCVICLPKQVSRSGHVCDLFEDYLRELSTLKS